MILRLAVEQARSQKRYTLWTAALLTFALTLTTFGLILLANQLIIQRDSARAWANDRNTILLVNSGLGHDPADPSAALEVFDELPLDTVEGAIADAIAEGSDVVAVRRAFLGVPGSTAWPGSPDDADAEQVSMLRALAVTGGYDWDVLLSEGSAPGPGEIALSAGWAKGLGLEVGDSVSLSSLPYWAGPNEPPSPSVEYEISGLLKTCGDSFGYQPSCPGAVLAWEDSAEEGGPFTYPVHRPSDNVRIGWVLETYVSYSIDVPALTAFDPFAFGYRYGYAGDWVQEVPPGTYLTVGIAALLVIGMVVMAFAVGRAQAQARLQWVATARTLGATRRTVVAASAIETLLVAAAATTAALAIGTLAAIAHRSIHAAVVPHPFIPDTLSLPWWMFGSVAASGLVLATIIAAVPAFWAARMPPVAALKPTSDIMEAEVSRRVRVRWLVPPFVLGLVVMALSFPSSFDSADAYTRGYAGGIDIFMLGAVLACATGFPLALEGLRLAIPACGRWLSHRRAQWAIAAGDTLAARPRQGVAPAFLQAVALTGGALVVYNLAVNTVPGYVTTGPDGIDMVFMEYMPLTELTSMWPLIISVFAILQVITLAIFFVGQRAISGEAATRRALGLSEAGQRRASFLQYVAPQALGVVYGACLGLAMAAFLHASTPRFPDGDAPSMVVLEALGHSVVPCLWLMAIAAAVSVAGGLVATCFACSRTPVEALRQTG